MGIRLTWRQVLAGYAVWMALLVATRYAFPGARVETSALIEVSAVAAMLAGVASNRPARRAPWLLLAAANLAAAVGGLSLHVVSLVSHPAVPFPAFADGAYLVDYPLYVAGLALFIRSRSSGRDVRSVADALIFLVGLALLSWVILVVPDAANPSLTWIQRFASVAYPIGNLLILLTLSRLLAPGPPHGTSTALLTFGTIALLVSDVAYDVVEFSGKYRLRPAARPRLAGLLHRLGGRGPAPVDGRVDPARRASGPGRLARHHGRADARFAGPADRPVRSLLHPPR